MIQVNLLPEVKLQFIRAKRLRRLITLLSVMVTGSAIVLFVLLFLTVNVWQKRTISDLGNDISALSGELKSTPDLDRILTVQSQLSSLPALHETKPDVKRLFTYLNQITPAEVTMSKLTLTFDASTIEITGSAGTLAEINKFVDTLKFTNYRTTPEAEAVPAFSGVVMSAFSLNREGGANYGITLNFDPVIFSSIEPELKLVVPNIVTTRSQVEQPRGTFQQGIPEADASLGEGEL